MTTTQLFAELLVIGIGAAFWLGLLLAAAFGYRFDVGIPKLDTSLFVVLLAIAYVLGIVVDRLAYAILSPLEKVQSSAIMEKAALPSPQEMERYIVVASEALGRQIQYNRSRLRICRAWVLNALLISLTFVAWNMRVGAVSLMLSLALVGVGFAICILMGWTARTLLRDYYKNLLASYEFLKSKPEARGS